MSNNIEKGYVFILTNESFRENMILIGSSSEQIGTDDLIEVMEIEELPRDYEVFATMHTKKYKKVEEIIKRQIDRLSCKRFEVGYDFFILSPSEALVMLMDFAMLIDDATVYTYHDGEASQVYFPVTPSLDEEEESLNQE